MEQREFIISPINDIGGIRLMDILKLSDLVRIYIKGNEEAFYWANNCSIGDQEIIDGKNKVIRIK